MGPFGPEEGSQLGGVDVVEAALYVKEERGLEAEALTDLDLMRTGGSGVKGRQTCE